MALDDDLDYTPMTPEENEGLELIKDYPSYRYEPAPLEKGIDFLKNVALPLTGLVIYTAYHIGHTGYNSALKKYYDWKGIEYEISYDWHSEMEFVNRVKHSNSEN